MDDEEEVEEEEFNAAEEEEKDDPAMAFDADEKSLESVDFFGFDAADVPSVREREIVAPSGPGCACCLPPPPGTYSSSIKNSQPSSHCVGR